MRLNDLPRGTDAVIDSVDDNGSPDPVAARLRELGFVPGEAVRIVATAPLGGDPLAVRIGFTRFALRRTEAQRVRVHVAKEAA
ncbi:ferrous iron transport protein A [Komagataeibacter nataicola]|uniref:Ferrous iron transport protein A n=1 Tax=Komagataeibacter nataicola TaxID=265960 RepID=A0A9N7CYB3_9PROT|nr:FeoA family protein [Komagataeibacter nataicola]AQU87751.1 ferrous iron transport protein A [Komagataeibacter nataicola]PYD65486.1 ferrous iron transport protein A [Komagataeibacter nataicola]WEQ55494.1 FeoA family protein [Komagataeibacter nataicola]WNM09647.1 FeoA family protein [Komagataeibacter nataicola]GBR16465.1 ferrous iron transport protein A [Komagataeibacter nataicola NRIC 0616]